MWKAYLGNPWALEDRGGEEREDPGSLRPSNISSHFTGGGWISCPNATIQGEHLGKDYNKVRQTSSHIRTRTPLSINYPVAETPMSDISLCLAVMEYILF